jgi:AAA domain-containing protein
MTLLETIKQYYGTENVTKLEKEQAVYRCIKKSSSGIRYQIVFIDISDSWNDENYSKYIESIVVDDYYEMSGYLQWNFYYYFISQPEFILKNIGRKKDIEYNEAYARKYVMSEVEFTECLKATDSISQISAELVTADLYTTWINILRDKKLYFVYNEAEYPNYKQPSEDYINGKEFEDIEDDPAGRASSERVLEKIDTLKLKSFRKYPVRNGDFIFGKVNLIQGPNATGKTSFFNALELIITGSSSNGNPTASYDLEFVDNLGYKWIYPSPNIYKERDIFWYNSAMTRGHNLNGNFNRFNYYSSDAAFLLKQNNDRSQNNLEEIIAEIALGREVNRLEERITEFKKRFESWKDFFIDEERKLNAELAVKNDSVKKLKEETKDPANYREALIKCLSENKWKNNSSDDPQEFIISIENLIQIIENYLAAILSKNLPKELLSLAAVREQIKIFEEKQTRIKSLRETLLINRSELQLKSKEGQDITALLVAAKELSDYFNHVYFNHLIGLGERIKKETAEAEKSKRIQDEAKKLNHTGFLTEENFKQKGLKQIEMELEQEKVDLLREKRTVQENIGQLEIGINTLSKIISDIKSMGSSYLTTNPTAENCPLCDTPFPSPIELLAAIQSSKDTFANSQALLTLKETELRSNTALKNNQTRIDVVAKVKVVCLLLYGGEWGDKTFLQINEGLSENETKINIFTDSLTQLNIIQSQINTDNINESRFMSLKEKIEGNLKVQLNNASDLVDIQTSLDEKLRDSASSIEILQDVIRLTESDYRSIFDSTVQNEEAVSQKLTNFQEVENLFLQIFINIDLPFDTSFYSIFENVNVIKSAFEIYKKEYNESSQQIQALQYIQEESQRIVAQLTEILPKKAKSQFAFTELERLITEQNKNKYLTEYIDKNRHEIVTIFKLIHSPKEFSDIKLENRQVFLVTLENEIRSLNEISTGQRTALALSIFLSLNKKLAKGPNVIFLDDPITYIDDLNILSFLDYLRELILNANRQLFFATANDDLAFLFKKKFEFLGDHEFKAIPFSRNE